MCAAMVGIAGIAAISRISNFSGSAVGTHFNGHSVRVCFSSLRQT